jgi:hypothetical protein
VYGLEPLFRTSDYVLDAFHQSFAVNRDGSTFYLLRAGIPDRGTGATQAVLVEHWFSDVAKRMKQ